MGQDKNKRLEPFSPRRQPSLGGRIRGWLLLLGLGFLGVGLALASVVNHLAQTGTLPAGLWHLLTPRVLPPLWSAALVLAAALSIIFVSCRRLLGYLSAKAPSPRTAPWADIATQGGLAATAPSIVAIGGGHGLATLLRGLKHYSADITAIITVADDGGSSGRIRRQMGLPPPGDFRNCIAALADDESLTTQLFRYRFGAAPGPSPAAGAELAGHSLGNLLIAALTNISGSFESGLELSSRVLAIQGRILPSTLADVTLVGEVRDGPRVEAQPAGDRQRVRRIAGESQLPEAEGVIERVYLQPEGAPAYPASVRAILTADLVVLGPGSLYTSVLPNLLVSGIRDALHATAAPVVHVCNIVNQPGETDGYDTDDFIGALERHVGPGVVDLVLANTVDRDLVDGSLPFIQIGVRARPRTVSEAMTDLARPWRHDSDKLARAIVAMVEDFQSSRRESHGQHRD